jgi:hypothetical protein
MGLVLSFPTHLLNPINKFLLTFRTTRLTLHPACTGGISTFID